MGNNPLNRCLTKKTKNIKKITNHVLHLHQNLLRNECR